MLLWKDKPRELWWVLFHVLIEYFSIVLQFISNFVDCIFNKNYTYCKFTDVLDKQLLFKADAVLENAKWQ